LAEAVEEERDRDTPLLGLEQRRQELDAVSVELDVIGREIQKEPGLANHRETTRPLGLTLPERSQRRGGEHEGASSGAFTTGC